MTTDEKGQRLADVIIDTCRKLNVQPSEALDVLGTAIVGILASMAPAFGLRPKKMLQVFAKGIAKARLVKREVPEQAKEAVQGN